MQDQGMVPISSILSKSVLETATGRRVWEMLRFLSDYAIRVDILRRNPSYPIPNFLMTLSDNISEEEKLFDQDEQSLVAPKLPALANISRNILNRNRIGAIVNINKQSQKFKEVSQLQLKEKEAWIETSKKMNDLYNNLKEEIQM